MSKKIVWLLMAFCSIALVLTGCNGNNAGGNTQIGEETGENTMNSSGGYTGSSVPYSMCLDGKDGEWRALHDADNTGFDQNWQLGEAKNWAGAAVAPVPGNFYMITDGTGEKKVGIWWFRRTFEPEVADGADMRYFLQFGAVDYYCEIYLNGTLLGTHEGQEVGFAVEATEALKLNEKNVLVVKVYEPGFGEAIIPDMAIESIPTGQSFGGIQRSVYLIASGELALEDLYCIPEYETGKITNRITVNNPSSEPRRLSVTVTVTENGSGGCIYQNVSEAEAEPGSGVISIDAQLKDYKLWDINAPTLYNVTVTLDYTSASGEDRRSQKTERIGFRDFRVKDGWFFLNGRRIFLKCAHTSNTSTVYRSNQDEDAQVLEDIYKMKAAGFNCIRFLHTPANQEQLDLCDELGIMVYQEHPASWPWRSGTVVEERFLRSLEQRLLSDRNHPGIVIWGLLNENSTPSTFILARDSLSMLKDIDDTRVFLLNSGRFDQIFETGSVSNPGSEDWEAVWGYEGEKQVASRWGYEDFPEYYRGCGDIHIYPREQASAKLREVFSFFGVGTKPVFISEGGVGSAWNAIASARYLESIHASPNSDSIPLAKAEEQYLRMILKKFGLESVYPVAEDFYKDTEAKQAQQRKLYFDLIRSNPQVAGYSFTSAVDGGYVGEGFLGFIREFKKDQLEVIQQGWASLRWCMFASPAAIYADEEITLEAVLANEDVLDEGTYKATLTVFGDEGIVWRQKCTFDIQKEGDYLPLAVEVFREKVKIDGLKEGTYTFAAELTKGGYAVADRTTFTVKERAKTQRLSGTVYTFGEVDDGVLKLLREYGAEVKELTLNSPQTDREVILVGKTVTWSKSELSQLYRRIAAGSHAVFLYPAMLANETDLDYVKLGKTKKTAVNLMFENSTEKATLVRPWQWLYHTEAVAKPCPMLTGLDDRGIMDIEFYSSAVADRMYIEGMPLMPEEYGVVDIGIGNSVYDSGYSAGIVLGSFGFYSGSYTVSCFSLADNIGQPGADRLLVNIVARAAQLANAAQEVSQEAETAIRQFLR